MKIYTAKVMDVGSCFKCGLIKLDESDEDKNIIENKVNVIEIEGYNIIHEIRLCDKCAVELRELLGDIE